MAIPPWQPAELLARVQREPLAVMRKGVGAAPFLIVRLDDFSNDLGHGLASSDEAANRKLLSRSIRSTLQLSTAMTEQLGFVTEEVSPSKPTEEASNSSRAGFPVPEWLNARCYVVSLATRTGPAPIPIGRDPSHKIVLLHPSVSATHAYITVGAQVSLRDAKSRNGTLVNGAPIKGTVTLQVGDRIKFGAVQAVLCSAEDLWHAVR